MSAPAHAPAKGRLPTIEWVPIGELLIDDSYQRSIETQASQKLIAAIARDWDWDLVDVLKVSRRPDDRLFLVDGGGAKLRPDIPQLPCVIKRCAGPAEEARLFVAANRGRKSMNRLDDFRAAVGAGDQEATTIERLVREAGLVIARAARPKLQDPGELAIVAPLQRALRVRGEKIVGAALRLIGEAFPDEAIVGASPLFGALTEILALTEADYDRLFTTLLAGTSEDWSEWAQPAQSGGQSKIIAMRAAIEMRYMTAAAAA